MSAGALALVGLVAEELVATPPPALAGRLEPIATETADMASGSALSSDVARGVSAWRAPTAALCVAAALVGSATLWFLQRSPEPPEAVVRPPAPAREVEGVRSSDAAVPLATLLDIELRDIQVLVFWANTEQAASGASVEWKALTESAPEAVAGRLPAVTNAAGQALLSVPAESAAIVLTAQHVKAETYRIQLETQSGNPVRIELQLVFWIRGIVRDVETGAVLPGATVALGADEKHEAISGADGGFHIRDLRGRRRIPHPRSPARHLCSDRLGGRLRCDAPRRGGRSTRGVALHAEARPCDPGRRHGSRR